MEESREGQSAERLNEPVVISPGELKGTYSALREGISKLTDLEVRRSVILTDQDIVNLNKARAVLRRTAANAGETITPLAALSMGLVELVSDEAFAHHISNVDSKLHSHAKYFDKKRKDEARFPAD